MKFKINLPFATFLLLLTNCTTTQKAQTQTTIIDGDAEFMADQQTAEMAASLDLTTEQIPKVEEIILKYIKKTQELRQNAGEDRSTMQDLRKLMNNEKNAEMKLVLTEVQYNKYLSIQAENIGRRGIRSGKGGGGRRG